MSWTMDSLRKRVAERLAVATSPPSEGPRPVTSFTESSLRQYWMPDAVSVECYECSARFTTFRRKHHCRVCGRIFCSKCCNIFISGKYLRCSGTLRVCVYCHKYFSQQHQSALDEEELENSQDQSMSSSQTGADLSAILNTSPSSSFLERTIPHRLSSFMGNSNSGLNASSLSENSPNLGVGQLGIATPGAPTVRKKSSAMIRPNFLTRDDDIDQNGVKTPRSIARMVDQAEMAESDNLRPEINLKDPQKLEKLWEQIVNTPNGIPVGTRRYQMKMYHGCFTGNDIIEWLQARDGTTWRSQAVAFGQALLDGGYLEDLTVQTNTGSITNINICTVFDETRPYRPILKHKNDETDVGNEDLGSSVENHFDADGPEWLQQVDFPMEGDSWDTESDWRPWVPKLSTNWGPELPVFAGVRDKARETTPLSLKIDTDSTSPHLDSLYRQHIEDYLNRLMRRENLSSRWTELILTFCLKIVSHIILEPVVDPDLRRVNMDIRDFVKIKRIPGGAMEDSSIVKGEVFSNRVIRVGMPLSLDNTNILLIKDSIAYAREDRYVSLENMKLQEDEYTKNICHKIKSFLPKLILVEKTVCRSAQDILCDAGIAVVLNVKPKVLKRVSRLFSTPIVESLASMVELPILGACDRYRSRMFDDISAGEPKNLISLEGRDLKNSCTVLLRGGSGRELSKVKRIIRRLLLLKLHCKYERSFLLHQDVQIESFPEMKTHRFHEMTLSPFVNIPCEDMILSDFDIDDDVNSRQSNDGSPTDEKSSMSLDSDQSYDNSELCKFEQKIFTRGFDDVLTRNLLADYRASCTTRSRSVNPKPKPAPVRYQIPFYYKMLESKFTPMLFGSHAPTTVNYCVPPWVVKMSFYHQNDIPLGVFLDSFCFDDTYKCPSKKECNIPMRDHIRRFCLGDACVTLIVQAIGTPVVQTETNTIFMWKFCNDCRNMSSILPLSYNSWMLSFSMFLLLCLNETELVRRPTTDEPCPHSIHRDQFTCFAKGELVALFKVSPIVFCSIVFPSSSLLMPPLSTASDRLLADLKDLSVKGSNLFSQINGKIVKLKAEGTYESFVSELLQEQEEDMAEYREKVDQIRDRIQLVDAVDLLETQCSVVALNSAIYNYYVKWEAKLQQIQELKRKEEKLGKTDPRARMSSGGTGTSTPAHPSGHMIAEKLVSIEKIAGPASVPSEDSLSAPSRIWHTMITSVPNESLLVNPLPLTVHPSLTLPGRPIIVDEAQPSSIIAFALAKPEYHEFLLSRAKAESDTSSCNELSLSAEASEKQDQKHFKCQFSDDHCRFYVCVHFAYEFHKFRELVLVRDESRIDFLASLSECKQWSSSGGKSGMAFFKTKDDRFIIKQMSSFEHNSFQDFAPHYFKYITSTKENKQKTLLAKILGVFVVGFRNVTTGKQLKMEVLVIENLFYDRNILETYDLKGSVRNRLANEGNRTDDQSEMQVLMDENLLKIARERPFYIRKDKNPEFYSAIQRDTNFLTQHSMMDYSLLVGIDAKDNLVLGIIDYIRTFTWDKKIEMMIKSTGFLGGRGKTPTIIYPKFYQKRFIEAMDTYFIQVPDYWYQFNQPDHAGET